MGRFTATVAWQRNGAKFTDNRYSRGHKWHFDGGLAVPASSSPDVVPLPYSVAANIDPEEAFVAALSSCHMLFFLGYAAQKGFVVDSYHDDAIGVLGKENGKTLITHVELRPRVVYGDTAPTPEEEADLHHRSHEHCFIANSVRTVVTVRSV